MNSSEFGSKIPLLVAIWSRRCERPGIDRCPDRIFRALGTLLSPGDYRSESPALIAPPPIERGDSLDAVYYLHNLKVVEAVEGSTIAADEAKILIEIVGAKRVSGAIGLAVTSGLGLGNGLQKLVHQDQLAQ